MKKPLVSVFCLFLFILSSPSAQIAKEPKVITINSVRVMEVFKKENKAQYSTKPDKTDKKKDTNSSEDKTESPTEQTAGTENISDTQTSVTTEEAQKAVEEKKDDIIVFTGGVSLSVKDGSTVSTIESDKLVYNRSENTIEAEGNVHYSRKSGGSDGAEEFIGELLLFNIDEMEGIFLDGTIKQAPRKQGQSPFTIQSATVGRDSSGVIGFKDAVLSTNPDPGEEPLWSIRASRIWMHLLTVISPLELCRYCIYRFFIILPMKCFSIPYSAFETVRDIFFKQQHIFLGVNRLIPIPKNPVLFLIL